jgi:hypothetical protein
VTNLVKELILRELIYLKIMRNALIAVASALNYQYYYPRDTLGEGTDIYVVGM